MSRFTKQRGEQIRDEIQNRERRYRSHRIDEAIQRGYEHLHGGDYSRLATLIRDILIPDLSVTRYNIRDHAQTVTDSGTSLLWNHEAVRRFTEDPERYLETASAGGVSGSDALYLRAAGFRDPRQRHVQTIIQTFHSLESLAVAQNYVSNSVTNWAPAKGYTLQIGTWYQPARDDMPTEIQLVDTGDSEEVTVNMGLPGRGKGVIGHTEAEDRHHAGRKIVDLVDFDECEGGVLDIPNANPTLRQAREQMGLPPDYTEHPDYQPPGVEIMVPLTDGLREKYIPYHGDGPTDTVVKPFTVPASRLSKRALKRFISAELTSTQENVFESAYDEIQRVRDDWNLRDLINAVERHRGLHGNQGAVDRVQRAIRRIENKGWIRDREDPHAINWERILTDTSTATVFTAMLMDDTDEAAQYLFHSYVIYGFRTELKRLKELPAHERDGWDHVPKITALARELHKIAPNHETASDDPTIRAIQDAMASDFRDLTAMHRHEGVEIIADTQNFIGEIKKRSRKNFNRACLFQVNFSDAKAMFEEISGEGRDQYPRRVTQRFGVGECAVLGRVGTGRPFEMTVGVAPPMSHHFDPDEWIRPGTGEVISREDLKDRLGGHDPEKVDHDWQSVNSALDLRVYLLGEEYRPAAELLDASGATEVESTDLGAVRAQDKRPESGPGQFAWDCLEIVENAHTSEPGDRLPLYDLEHAYRAYARDNGHRVMDDRSNLCQLIGSSAAPVEDEGVVWKDLWDNRRPSIHGHPDADSNNQVSCYVGVTLNETGEQYLDAETGDREGGEGGSPPTDPGGGADTSASEGQHPGRGEVKCCSSPEPVPMYAGEDGSRQVGWRCEACGDKTFTT